MNNYIYLIAIILLTNFISFYFLKYLSNLINVYDFPDKENYTNSQFPYWWYNHYVKFYNINFI